MFGPKYSEESPIRSRSSKFPGADNATCKTGASSVRRSSFQQHSKPWFKGTNSLMAVAAASSAALCEGTSSTVQSRLNSSNNKHSLPSLMEFDKNVNNVATTNDAPEDKQMDRADVKPKPYHSYNPVAVRHVQSDRELPIHYWFYIYVHSSDVDKMLSTFVKMANCFGSDRRLAVIMNRYGVQILLKELELYKSLPRRIVVIKGFEWPNIVKALQEMEDRLPDLMRFASYPLLLDTDTTKFACTKFDRTACINRL